MRKKVYYQNAYGPNLDKDYVLNGYKTTFGIFSKEFSERRPSVSPKLREQMEYIWSTATNPNTVKMFFHRYHSNVSYYNSELNMKFLQCLTAFLVLRELPIKNFYARGFLIGCFTFFVFGKSWKYNAINKPVYFMNYQEKNDFANYPLIHELVTKKIDSKRLTPR